MNIQFIGTRQIPIGGKNALSPFAIIDEQDYERLAQFKWHGDKDGYPSRTMNIMVNGRIVGRQIRMHQDILGYEPGKMIDHIHGNIYDNRRSELRFVTPHQNSMNKGIGSRNTSGYLGISWSKFSRRWVAQIQVKGKSINLGGFKSLQKAREVRAKAASEYFGSYRRPGV